LTVAGFIVFFIVIELSLLTALFLLLAGLSTLLSRLTGLPLSRSIALLTALLFLAVLTRLAALLPLSRLTALLTLLFRIVCHDYSSNKARPSFAP
jgi:hypothetical protein